MASSRADRSARCMDCTARSARSSTLMLRYISMIRRLASHSARSDRGRRSRPALRPATSARLRHTRPARSARPRRSARAARRSSTRSWCFSYQGDLGWCTPIHRRTARPAPQGGHQQQDGHRSHQPHPRAARHDFTSRWANTAAPNATASRTGIRNCDPKNSTNNEIIGTPPIRYPIRTALDHHAADPATVEPTGARQVIRVTAQAVPFDREPNAVPLRNEARARHLVVGLPMHDRHIADPVRLELTVSQSRRGAVPAARPLDRRGGAHPNTPDLSRS